MTYAPACRTSNVLVPDTTPGAYRIYPHEPHCNADRHKPLGCDMCSCKYGRLIARTEQFNHGGG